MDDHVIMVLMTQLLLLVFAIKNGRGEATVSVTPRYTSLSGDLHVIFNVTRLFSSAANATYQAEAAVTCDDVAERVATVALHISTPSGKFAFKCGSLLHGGFCRVLLSIKSSWNASEVVRSNQFEVRWPSFKLTAPTSLETFTSDVSVSLEATGIACPPVSYAPSTWLELAYVRHNESAVTAAALSHRVIAHVNDVYKIVSRQFNIGCSWFDQAGVYQVRLKTNLQRPFVIASSAPIGVRWSEHYEVAFQPTAFPCSSAVGVTVFYRHPKCILPGDKIRVYGRLKVSPSAPAASPSVYVYVVEKRVEPGVNSVTFSCHSLNKRRYVEYCAKYVSMAQHGAVSEVRSACVTTQQNTVAVDGQWSSWSLWSSCTGGCSVGTRTRHRVCDNPAPAYGGRFCDGHPVQSGDCTLPPCPNRTVVQSPVDTYPMSEQCRCGCQMNLTTAATYVASSGFYCPSVTASWTFTVGRAAALRFTFVHFDLNDTLECLQIRNGQLPSSELLLHETGKNLPRPVITSLPVALLRYHSTTGVKSPTEERLGLGFVVKVEAIKSGAVTETSESYEDEALMVLSPLHLAALVFCIILVCFTLSFIGQHFWNVVHKRPSDEFPQSPLTGSPGSFRDGFYPSLQPVTSTTSVSDVSPQHELHRHRYQRKRLRASADSVASSQLCKSPEDYLRDSKLFQTSMSSLDTQLSVEMQPASSPTKITVVHPRQQPLMTPGMTRKLPVATVSPQPARVVSPPASNKSLASEKKKTTARDVDEQSRDYPKTKSEALVVDVNGTKDGERKKKKKTESTPRVLAAGVRLRSRESAANSRPMMASLSEFSLTENDEDNFEYDYYDYGMNAQPGSYLSGQFPVWLPPFLPVGPSAYDNMEVPMQHFSLSGSSNPNSRPISDASTYQESSADELVSASPSGHSSVTVMGVYNQAHTSNERIFEKPSQK